MSAAQEQESERVEYRTNEIDTTWSSGKEFWFLVEGIHESLSQVLIPLSMARGNGVWEAQWREARMRIPLEIKAGAVVDFLERGQGWGRKVSHEV